MKKLRRVSFPSEVRTGYLLNTRFTNLLSKKYRKNKNSNEVLFGGFSSERFVCNDER